LGGGTGVIRNQRARKYQASCLCNAIFGDDPAV
jgi:hypothetical protein